MRKDNVLPPEEATMLDGTAQPNDGKTKLLQYELDVYKVSVVIVLFHACYSGIYIHY